MDWNLSRRKRELEIAEEVAGAFLLGTSAMDASPQRLIGVFTSVCEGHSITPDDSAISRILGYALKAIDRRKRALDDLAAALDRLPPVGLQP